MSKKRLAACPSTLGDHGRKFWRTILKGYELKPEELIILETVCMNLDEYHNCREILSREGYVISSSRGNKFRPEVVAGKEAYRSFLMGCKFLHIDEEEEKEKKPVGHPVENRWTVQRERRL